MKYSALAFYYSIEERDSEEPTLDDIIENSPLAFRISNIKKGFSVRKKTSRSYISVSGI